MPGGPLNRPDSRSIGPKGPLDAAQGTDVGPTPTMGKPGDNQTIAPAGSPNRNPTRSPGRKTPSDYLKLLGLR